MKLKYALKFIFHIFCTVTTFQILFVATYGTLYPEASAESFRPSELFKFPFIGLMSSLPILVYVSGDTVSKTEAFVRKLLHFILTAGIVFGLLYYFQFIDAANALMIVCFFLGIYIPAFVIQSIRAKKLAREINEKLNAFHDNEDEDN